LIVATILAAAPFSAADQSASGVDMAIADNSIIEEVLVTAIDRCGPWPIAHESIIECSYPELKRDQLRQLRELREHYFDACLTCTDETCSPKPMPREFRREKFICKRLFQTPRWIPRTQMRVLDVGYLVVEFQYNITRNGKAADISIVDLESDLDRDIVLEIITKSADEARFEPVIYQGRRVALMNLHDSYILEH